jgi:hypothetical protein
MTKISVSRHEMITIPSKEYDELKEYKNEVIILRLKNRMLRNISHLQAAIFRKKRISNKKNVIEIGG